MTSYNLAFSPPLKVSTLIGWTQYILFIFDSPQIFLTAFLFYFIFLIDKSRNLLKFVSVLLSASVKRVGVSRMRDFFLLKRLHHETVVPYLLGNTEKYSPSCQTNTGTELFQYCPTRKDNTGSVTFRFDYVCIMTEVRIYGEIYPGPSENR